MRRMLLALVCLVSACINYGVRPSRLSVANGPFGAEVAVRVRAEDVDRVGELYAVAAAGVTLRARTLVRIAWSRVVAIDVEKFGARYDVTPGETVTDAKRSRLSLVSRFPQGLNGPLLSQVLARLGQSALEEIK